MGKGPSLPPLEQTVLGGVHYNTLYLSPSMWLQAETVTKDATLVFLPSCSSPLLLHSHLGKSPNLSGSHRSHLTGTAGV